MSMKNSNDTIPNRNRDLPACSTVPLTTAPPRAPRLGVVLHNYHDNPNVRWFPFTVFSFHENTSIVHI